MMRATIYIIIILASLYTMFNHSSSLLHHNGNPEFRCDFMVYWYAGHGDLHYGRWGYLYPEGTQYLFYWVRWMPYETASWLWMVLQLGSILLLVKTLFKVFDNDLLASATVLVFLKPIMVIIMAGNITPILAFLCLSPVGSVVAGCLKFYLLCFVLLHLLLDYSRFSKAASGNIHVQND